MRNPELKLNHKSINRETLLAFAKETPGALIGLKIAALMLTLEGQRPGWISEVLGLTRMSLNRWVHAVNNAGLDALKPKTKPGRPSRIDRKLQNDLQEHLEKSPEAYGLNRAHWDGPTLVIHLKRQYGITLKVRQAQKWLHQLGYSFKRASYTYLQASGEEARKFRKALKKTLPSETQ